MQCLAQEKIRHPVIGQRGVTHVILSDALKWPAIGAEQYAFVSGSSTLAPLRRTS